MFSVTPEIYQVLSPASRWLFAFIALLLLFFAFSWLLSERKERRERFKNLPGAGTVGELVVLSGGQDLAPDTWYPVPREGVLGSLRSCDLVVPCPGVRSQHLDFSWQDGVGLLIRPRSGCEVLIDGVPLDRRNASADAALLHGSVLQVGSAVLRLQLFSALSHTNRPFAPAVPAQGPLPPEQAPVPPVPYPPPPVLPAQDPGFTAVPCPPEAAFPVVPPPPADPVPQDAPSVPAEPRPVPSSPRRKRVDRWKEDWSE